MESAEAEASVDLDPSRPEADKQLGHDGRRINPKPRLRCPGGCVGRRLTTRKASRAVESAQAEASVDLDPSRPEADKQLGHDGRRISPTPRLRCPGGCVCRRLTTRKASWAVESAQAEASVDLDPSRPEADKQLGHDGRRISPKPRLRYTLGYIGRRPLSSEATKRNEVCRSRSLQFN